MAYSLRTAKLKAKHEGWSSFIRNEVDEIALTEGCWFDRRAADHATDFFETCLYHHGEPVRLYEFQRDAVARIFGWKRPSGFRRFRQAGVWLPKKNSKSWLSSGIILYLLTADGEQQAEVFSVATSTDQAKIVFREAAAMARSSPYLREPYTQVLESSRRIVFPATNSYYQVLSSRAASAEGFSISGLVVDELHRHRTDDLFNALRWGGAARKQPLLVTISTAGLFDPESIAWRQYQYACNVRDNALPTPDTSFLPIVYEADPEDDWTQEAVWKKANPGLVPERGRRPILELEDFRRDCEEAKTSAHNQNAFKRYRLNLWTQSVTAWISDVVWSGLPKRPLTDEQIQKMTWYGGLDLSSTTDITALVLVGQDAEGFVHLHPTFWVSAEQAKKRQELDGVQYLAWCDAGLVRKTEGFGVQYNKIKADLEEIRKTYKIKKLGIDRWQANQLAQELADEGWNVEWMGQGFKTLSAPTKEFERLAVGSKLVCPHPVMRWMVRNVVLESDAADNVKPTKKRSKEKIDGVVAACMGLGLLMHKPKRSMYETQGVLLA